MDESDLNFPAGSATVAGFTSWRHRLPELAALLGAGARDGSPRVIPTPPDSPTPPDMMAEVSVPQYWADNVAALADAMGHGSALGPSGTGHTDLGAVSTGPDRLTLTVEEAAASLGISRASAYEAVRRGEIPAIRIGRRILVPKTALARLLEDSGLDS